MRLALRADETIAEIEEGPALHQILKVLLPVLLLRIGAEVFLTGLADHPTGVDAAQLEPALREVGEAKIRVHLPEPIGGGIGEIVEARLAVCQGLLTQGAFRDVANHAEQGLNLAGRVHFAAAMDRDMTNRAIRPNDAKLELEGGLGL